MSYEFMQHYWWFLVSLLGALLVFLMFVQGANSLIFSLGADDTERRMLVMRGDGMTLKEIAAACGTTPASAKTMICSARKQLMTLLSIRRKGK